MYTLNLSITAGKYFLGAVITCKNGDGDTFPLAGWTAYAQARENPDSPIIVDFRPVIIDSDTTGKITIPPQSPTETAYYPEGEYPWDLILKDPDGIEYPNTLVSGLLTITRTISQSTASTP